MNLVARIFFGALSVLFLTGLNGCLPSSQSQLEEEKESHFQAGKNCVNSMDYAGAIEEFTKSLRANPDSASAHFQLGWLYEEKEPDPAAAIYHYECYLKLRPASDNAEVIRQHITNCKQDLAKTVLMLPGTPGMQYEIEKVVEENKRLREELERWKAYAGQQQAPSNLLNQASASSRTAGALISTTASSPTNNLSGNFNAPRSIVGRTYVVQSGDTPYSIARKSGIKLESLLAANPGVDPKRLKVGQVLNLPSR